MIEFYKQNILLKINYDEATHHMDLVWKESQTQAPA